ncbi:MAG: hypothetical protein IJA34_15260 [Lachnospiraceae bacterium]|nr:hypothetical protein [Lachnospiraceae bacterium]
MFDSKKIFEKINPSKKVVAKPMIENNTDTQTNQIAVDNVEHTMYEIFTPAMGIGKKFVITENSIIYGKDEYLYTQLTPICIVNPPMPLSNGTASTKVGGKELVLAFDYNQKNRFSKAMVYANEKIDLLSGVVRNYKYMLQSEQGTKIEIYEDYVIIYELKAGLGSIVGNSMAGGADGKVIYFTDMSVSLVDTESNTSLQIVYNDTEFVTIILTNDQMNLAHDIITYINDIQNNGINENEIILNKWENISGTEKEFSLNGKRFSVSQEMDEFNSYRLKFQEFALICTENARREYDKKVQNLVTYVEFFPKIYYKYRDVLFKQVMDILISEGIWTVTKDLFENQHTENFHMALDEFSVTLKSMELTSQANQEKVAGVMGLVPNLVGGGFGLKGAAKGIATAQAFNLVRDATENSLTKAASKINQAQQTELYERINTKHMFKLVFLDYWRVFLSLINVLNKNGKQIWCMNDELCNQAKNVFSNLSNPSFPQDKVTDVFLDILKMNPYDIEFYKYMLEKYGDNEETKAIKNYFGYYELSDIEF